MTTIPSLSDVTDILDTDLVMVTNAQGQSYKIAGSELNKRGKIIIANSTTVTGTPLKSGWPVRIYFTADITAANATTTMQINYNNVNYYVKVPKNGALVNYVAFNLGGSPAVFKYVQAYTTLELIFDGTQFVIIGNPVVISSTDYTIYADGLKRVNSLIAGSKDLVTSGSVYDKTRFQQVLTYQQSVAGTTVVYLLITEIVKSTSNSFPPTDIDIVVSRGGVQVCLLGNVKLVKYYNSLYSKVHWEYMNGDRSESLSVVQINYNNKTYLAIKMDTTTIDSSIICYVKNWYNSNINWELIANTNVTNEIVLTNAPLSS